MSDGLLNPAMHTSQARLAMDVQGLNQIKATNRVDGDAGLRQAAEEFEAVFIGMMMQSMRDATGKSELFDSSQTQQMQGMYDQQLSRHLATRGMGLADQLVQQLQQGPVKKP
ncbi:MAG: rod-binding protein [Idiomarina sp.]|nr:rod-binding protein [Idiomarina sp.]